MPNQQPTRPRFTTSTLLLLLAIVLPLHAKKVAEAPRELSDAERAGFQLALDYFEEGPSAWWDQLASSAPLRELGREAALAEIEVRVGATPEASWTMRTPAPRYDKTTVLFTIDYPSGHDQALVLSLIQEDEWKIATLKGLEDPVAQLPIFNRFSSTYPTAPETGSTSLSEIHPAPFLAGLVAIWLMILSLANRKNSSDQILLSLLGAALVLSACSKNLETEEEPAQDGSGVVELRELLPLRQALTSRDPRNIEELFAAAPSSGPAGEVALAWQAAQLTQELRLDEAKEILESLGSQTSFPLVDLTRARLALLSGDNLDIPPLYDRAMSQGIDHDGLRLEAAAVFGYLGLDEDAEILYLQLGEMGSRDPEVFYALAQLAALRDDPEDGEAYFKIGWELEPVEREELFNDPILAWLCTREGLFKILELNQTQEPSVSRSLEDRNPVPFPLSADAYLSGDVLRVAYHDADLTVLGGGVLAPEEIRVATADEVTRREREEALSQLDTLTQMVASGAVSRPAVRQEVLSAARALAEADRWQDLISLTNGLKPSNPRMDPTLGRLRARALTKSGRDSEALNLLAAAARNNLGNRLTAPAVLYQLAEILISREELKLAERLLIKAQNLSSRNFTRTRIAQVRMMQRLVKDSETFESKHFRIRYPRRTGERYASQVSHVLEEEYRRLLKWIPLEKHEPIDVDLFPFEEFMDSYSRGVSIVGLYDGRVRVPFADLRSLHPQIVTILTHEIAHAMIAEQTGDRAPKWLHEGLAQHVEMVQVDVNPVPDLYEISRVFTLPVVQAILGGFAETQFVDLSYRQAAWAIHFIESAHGVRGIHRLLGAFADGDNTEQALASALETNVDEFDQAFWLWSTTKAPALWPTKLRRYDEEAFLAEITTSSKSSAIPRLGKQGFGRDRPDPRAAKDRQLAMHKWHQVYSRKIDPIRPQLGTVINYVRGQINDPEVVSTCSTLARELGLVLQEERVMQTQDTDLNKSLKLAFEAFVYMAQACQRGHTSVMTNQLEKGQNGLRGVAAALSHYGLKP